MMQKMMDSMIKSMPKEQREKIILEMMPEMMKKADFTSLTKNMTVTIGKMISLYTVYAFIDKLIKEKELTETLSYKLNELKGKLPEMMETMMPVMKPIMKKTMPKVMEAMLPIMAKMLGDAKDCMMAEIADEHLNVKEQMGGMMAKKCPTMAGKVIPEDQRKLFVKEMIEKVIIQHDIKLSEEEITSLFTTELA